MQVAEHERAELVHCLYDFTQDGNRNPVNPTTYVEIQIAGVA